MRHRRTILLAGLGLAGSPGMPPAMAAAPLRIGGTGGALPLLQHLGEMFTRRTGVPLDVVANLGSAGGMSALAGGMLDLAVSGRRPNAAEAGRDPVEHGTLRTPYVLVTSHPAPPAITGREVVAAYASDRAAWPDGTPLRLVLRPRADSDSALLAGLFPGTEAAVAQARRRPDVPVAGTDQDSAVLTEKLAGSLTGMSYTQAVMERRNLRMVALDGVAPTLEAFESGTYPHGKTYRLLHARQAAEPVRQFLLFLAADEAVRAMRGAGCLPGAA